MKPETRMSEDDLLRSVIDLAQLLGLRVHHSRPARTTQGWRTPISGHKGLPDLVIVGPGGVLWRELKSATGKLSVDQVLWLADLRTADQDAGVWRPNAWPDRIQDEMEAIREGHSPDAANRNYEAAMRYKAELDAIHTARIAAMTHLLRLYAEREADQ